MIPLDARQWWIVFVTFLVVSGLVFFALVSAISQTVRGPSVYDTAPSVYDKHLTALDRAALDEAYKKYRISLFESWMRDPTEQPKRGIFGAEKAREVYINVMTAIEQRPK